MKKMVIKPKPGSLRKDGYLYVPYRVSNHAHTHCDVMYDDKGEVRVEPSSEGDSKVTHETTGWVVNITPLIMDLKIDFGFKKVPMIEENGIVKLNILQ